MRVAFADESARLACQQVVVVQLETRESLVVDANEAEDLACEFVARIHTPRILEEAKSLDAQIGERLRTIDVHLAREIDERGIPRKSLKVHGRVAAEGCRDCIGSALFVCHR